MIGPLVHSTDFQRLLSTPTWSRSTHFAVHHLPTRPGQGRPVKSTALITELSTSTEHNRAVPVDDLPAQHWLGAVLPKRLAKRSVTRNLLRRQIRAAVCRHLPHLPPGLWVVRLRLGFARTDFVSGASDALRQAARAELDKALQQRQPVARNKRSATDGARP